MKTLVVLATLLLGTLPTHQARACDMGAIEFLGRFRLQRRRMCNQADCSTAG